MKNITTKINESCVNEEKLENIYTNLDKGTILYIVLDKDKWTDNSNKHKCYQITVNDVTNRGKETLFGGDKVNTTSRPRPLDAERAAHARRRHDGVRGVRPGAGAYGAGGEDDEGVEGFSSFLLDEKGTKNQGRHHRTHRTKRALPRHVGQARAPSPVEGGRSPGGKEEALSCGVLVFCIILQQILLLCAQERLESTIR